jgi:hypothetical protein
MHPVPTESFEELEQMQDFVEQLALLVVSHLEDFNAVWECANRVCDRYYAANAA